MALIEKTVSRWMIATLLGAVLVGSAATAYAEAIYKYRDRRGVINYTNLKPRGVTAQIVMVYCPACDPKSTVDFSRVPLKRSDFNAEIANAIRQNPVDEALVRAIIQAESAYNPNALSKAGAQGLMQLMPGTAAQYGVSDSYNPQQNIYGGTRYLRFLLNMFDGDIKLVSAAYNAGENNVLKYAGVPPFAETQVYVQRVAQLYQRYRVDLAQRDAQAAAAKLAAANAAVKAPTPAPAVAPVASVPPANPVAAGTRVRPITAAEIAAATAPR
jgi:soluble lytic murein transglycosylase-like protein